MANIRKSEWKNLINKNLAEPDFAEPASVDQIEAVEAALRMEFPPELRALLLESDGVTASYGAELVWSSERIQNDNLMLRQSAEFKQRYKPLDYLLFFGTDDNGDMYAFAKGDDGQLFSKEIYRWNREADSRELYAHGLKDYFACWAREYSAQEE